VRSVHGSVKARHAIREWVASSLPATSEVSTWSIIPISTKRVIVSCKFSVIVVTYQRDLELDRSLGGILRQTVGRDAMEICVINNGGAERARERWESRVDIWEDSERNLGCSGGRNRGTELTAAPILVFVDDDGVPADDFVEQLARVLDDRADAVAVRGRAVALAHPILTAMTASYNRGPRVCEDLLTLEGGSAIRRSAYEGAGGYDETRTYHEGMDLSARLLEQREDAKILYTPHAVLAHDYVQGFRHALRKAEALAIADARLEHERDMRLKETMRRPLGVRAVKEASCYFCATAAHTPYAHENGFDLVQCVGCGLLYVKQRPDDDEISAAVMSGLHRGEDLLNSIGQHDPRKVAGYGRVLGNLFRDKERTGDWLDIGSGHGEFLEALRARWSGLGLRGLEPCKPKADAARARGLEIVDSAHGIPQESVDAISALNVYSHLPDPTDTLRMWAGWLRPDGIIVLQTGDSCDLPVRHHHKPFDLPDHLSFANRHIVRTILERTGFVVLSTRNYRHGAYPAWQLWKRPYRDMWMVARKCTGATVA